jgi:hypothetical protein
MGTSQGSYWYSSLILSVTSHISLRRINKFSGVSSIQVLSAQHLTRPFVSLNGTARLQLVVLPERGWFSLRRSTTGPTNGSRPQTRPF